MRHRTPLLAALLGAAALAVAPAAAPAQESEAPAAAPDERPGGMRTGRGMGPREGGGPRRGMTGHRRARGGPPLPTLHLTIEGRGRAIDFTCAAPMEDCLEAFGQLREALQNRRGLGRDDR